MIGMIASPFGRRFGHVLAIFCRAIPFGALAPLSIDARPRLVERIGAARLEVDRCLVWLSA